MASASAAAGREHIGKFNLNIQRKQLAAAPESINYLQSSVVDSGRHPIAVKHDTCESIKTSEGADDIECTHQKGRRCKGRWSAILRRSTFHDESRFDGGFEQCAFNLKI